MRRIFLQIALITAIVLASCSSSRKLLYPQPVIENIDSLKLLNVYVVPHNFIFNNTTVGGLSSIDYDRVGDRYFMICDDRSVFNPARFYTAKINITAKGIDTVIFESTHPILRPDGTTYPNKNQDPANIADCESMRFDPVRKQLVWGNEGERKINEKDTILHGPSVNIMDTVGTAIGQYLLPDNMAVHPYKKGPMQNTFEGLTFAENYTSLFVSVEEPLFEDGPEADTIENNSLVRILKFDARTRKNTAQYAYKLGKVARAPIPADGFRVNGITDILWLGNNKFIVLERSYSVGYREFSVKLFLADFTKATDISTNPALQDNPGFTPVAKKLLLDMDKLGTHIDNLEGITFGPLLPNGNRTLLIVGDNNFSKDEQSQFFLFEIK